MILLVEPDDLVALRLAETVGDLERVRRCTTFEEARHELRVQQPLRLLVTNLQLRDYNGLHLVYLATAAAAPTRAIVYTVNLDPQMAVIVRQAGAFYETADCLVASLASYLHGSLPQRDRRDPLCRDRRSVRRFGRRALDSAQNWMNGRPITLRANDDRH